MARIPLTRGEFALVDNEDYFYLSLFKWSVYYSDLKSCSYARRNRCKDDWPGKKSSFAMHRLILGIDDSAAIIDLIDGNGLNNQKSNLRIVTQQQNCMNTTKKRGYGQQPCASLYKGVNIIRSKWYCKDQNGNRILKRAKHVLYSAQIKATGKNLHLGVFKNEAEAAQAYNKAAKEYFGEYAKLNIII